MAAAIGDARFAAGEVSGGFRSQRRCPVCLAESSRLFATIGERDYLRCGACEATFLCRDQLPTPEVEIAEYRLHRNRVDDRAYREFLGQLAQPLLARLKPRRHGLDYGCGPAPALAAIFEEAGHRVRLYDPFFHRDPEALERRYDFVTCTEVAEHFHHPAREFDRLAALLRPGGWLAIQTCFQTDDAAFARWNYRRDPTHVVFYRKRSFAAIARRHGWHCEFPARNVALLRNPA
ncbi:class I SAM-dependent methyltransferase [Thioalkalivibrio paradoxus]|uniref:Type 12 methyltransferase n=1 Tax=Thioalkalivibrio paradoxus ARh 1 TaxID=713585 RepID=W0DLM5_9GAMM|nr:class I SAM-dependent methyltransferase [Thioalkalivibrio paradoxus]AHE97898.1 type 12 methyltransferase [Thioalkalivibrio paradoxus ARh 1]